MTKKASPQRNGSALQQATRLSAQGRDKQALELVQAHLRKFPRDLEALNLAGTLAARLQDWPRADKFFASALDLNQTDSYALYNLSKVFEQSGRAGAAIELLTRLLKTEPGNVKALNQIGTLLIGQGHLDPGVQALETAIELDPLFETAYRNLYVTLYNGARYEQAVRVARRAIENIKSDTRWRFRADLILCLWQSQAAAEARQVAEDLIAELEHSDSSPGQQEILLSARNNYGLVLMELDQPEAAEVQFKKAIAQAPDKLDPYINLARLNGHQENFREAIGWYDKALAIDPGNASLHDQLAVFLRDANRPDLALPHHLSALAQRPGQVELLYELGVTQLALGHLPEAYKTWETRWARRMGGFKSDLPIAEWTGTPARGRSLLVYREQGIGDEVRFASCLPDILDRFERVVCVCHSKLKPLFARSFPRIEFRATADPLSEAEIGALDWQIAIGSLPPIVRPDLGSFPDKPYFLVPDPEKIKSFRKRLAPLRKTLTIGIGWRSGLLSLNRRAIYPFLDFWQALFAVPGVCWVNLQYGEVSAELREAEQRFGVSIVDFKDVDHFQDIDTSAAMMKACDLVIGPGTSTTVISAAVGTPTIHLIPGCDPCQIGTERYPWLSSLTPIRRNLGEPWTAPIERTAAIVRALLGERGA